MTIRYLGEVRMYAGRTAPANWAMCDGSLVNIKDNEVLYSLLGTRYGGDGVSTFALPDLRGRVPIHVHGLSNVGKRGGAETVALTEEALGGHTHGVRATAADSSTKIPQTRILASTNSSDTYSSTKVKPVSMNQKSIVETGGGLPHNNIMPSFVLNFIIALNGVVPKI